MILTGLHCWWGAQVVLKAGSELIGHSIRQVGFRGKLNASVIAVIRDGVRVPGKLGDIVLAAEDKIIMDVSDQFDRYSSVLQVHCRTTLDPAITHVPLYCDASIIIPTMLLSAPRQQFIVLAMPNRYYLFLRVFLLSVSCRTEQLQRHVICGERGEGVYGSHGCR